MMGGLGSTTGAVIAAIFITTLNHLNGSLTIVPGH
jgi:ABC-type branched-subunit amino acid transport system permease subunit